MPQYQYGVQLNTYIREEDDSYHSTELTDAVLLGNTGYSQTATSGSTKAFVLTTRLDSE